MASSSYPMTQIGARRESSLSQLPSSPTSKKKELILVTIYSFQSFPERRSRGRIRSFARSCATRSWEAVVMFRQGKPGSPNVSLSGPRSNTVSRHIKHTNAETVQQRINCQKRGSNMRRRWTSIISRPLIIFSERTMRLEELQTIRLICMGNSWRKQSRFWIRGSDMHSRMDRRICMCKFPLPVGH